MLPKKGEPKDLDFWEGMHQVFAHDIWGTFSAHPWYDVFLQVFAVLFILMMGMVSLRLVGKKSISQLTLPNVVFVFIYTTSLGALVGNPRALIISVIVTITIILAILLVEILQVKFDKLEFFMVGRPDILVQDGRMNVKNLKKAKITIDMLESQIRLQGIPSVEVCETITLEPNGNIGIETKPEYEPIKKIYFDEAVKQILKAINDSKYVEAVPPDMGNVFDEAKGKLDKQDEST